MIEAIVSGGQTGVDRAALAVAARIGIRSGGWCPQGRWSEAGKIPLAYPLIETPSDDPKQRTEWNVRDSDATLILSRESELHGGTALTEKFARDWNRPCLVVSLRTAREVSRWDDFLFQEDLKTLNIAGPRESEDPGIEDWATEILLDFLARGTRHTDRNET